MAEPRVAVVGGGIAGLVAAHDLHRAGIAVTVFESADRWGGKIASSPVGDRIVDAGPDSMLARVDAGRDLCAELGLADELTHPVAAIPAMLHLDGALQHLPAATVFGVPTDLSTLEGVISPAGIERARADLTDPWDPTHANRSVGSVCRARLGDEVTERLIDPLLGGINASHIDHLGLADAAPQLLAALEAEGSLIRGLAALRRGMGATLGGTDPDSDTAGNTAAVGEAPKPAPVFYGLPGGLARIIDRLVQILGDADLRLNTPFPALSEATRSATPDSAVLIDGDRFDAVIMAVPAFAAADILGVDYPEIAGELAGIEYASVAQVTVEYDEASVDPVLDTSGILFPRVGGTMLTACTWFSAKWAHYHRPGRVLLRLTSGRYGDERIADHDDDSLSRTLLDELRTAINLDGEPLNHRVQRWPRSLPQYGPGHRDRIARSRMALGDNPTPILLAGAAYDGIGIPACITSGHAAARQALSAIGLDGTESAGRATDTLTDTVTRGGRS